MGPPHGTPMGPQKKILTRIARETPPSNDYPPLEVEPAYSINSPPSISRNLIDYPIPGNRAGKLHQLPPPLEFTEPHRLPPSKSCVRENSINYPPSNSRNHIDYPPPPSKSGRKTPCSFSHGFRFSKLDKYGKVLIHY